MTPLEYLFGLEFHGRKFGLESILAITDALGRPQDVCPSAAVAGTNGKGSVCAFVSAALTAAGHRTGCYTSPHLVRIEERFAVDGEPVGEAELAGVVEDLRVLVSRMCAEGRLSASPTFFEVATAAAFELFRRRRVDVAVFEVGLGGRLDATTAAAPVAGAITNIDLDHQRDLGHTLAEIAREKAGIIKPGMRLVCGERRLEPYSVIAAACAERGATLDPAWDGVTVAASGAGGRQVVEIRSPLRRYGPLALALRGRHQVENAVVAVRLLEALDGAGVSVSGDAIEQGLQSARWPGRLELFRMADGRTALVDAAHNAAGAAALGDYLGEAAPRGQPLVFAAMRDKDHAAMLGHLVPHATCLVLTAPPTPRAARPGDLEAVARAIDPGARVVVEADPAKALAAAWAAAPDITVAGSIYLLGAVLPLLAAEAAG